MKKILALVLLTLSFSVFAAGAYNTKIGRFSNSDFVIGGYDVVAYFTQNAPVKGSEEFEYQWSDSRWLFSSKENLELFAANPEKYAPQYGGYCAWAVAHDDTAKINPSQFSIIDDKLYLNYDARIQKKWKKDTKKYIVDGNELWPDLLEDLLDE